MTEYKLNEFTIEVEKELRREAFKQNYYYENRYLHEFNQNCPLCNKTIKPDRKNVLSKIGIVGMISLAEEKLCISYALCKKCSKKLTSMNTEEKHVCENNISSHIMATLQ